MVRCYRRGVMPHARPERNKRVNSRWGVGGNKKKRTFRDGPLRRTTSVYPRRRRRRPRAICPRKTAIFYLEKVLSAPDPNSKVFGARILLLLQHTSRVGRKIRLPIQLQRPRAVGHTGVIRVCLAPPNSKIVIPTDQKSKS